MNPLREEQCYWNSAAADSCAAPSCAPWGSCAPWDSCVPWENCVPRRPVHLETAVPQAELCAMQPAVRHVNIGIACWQLCILKTAVCHVDSCVPYRQLCSLQTSVRTAGNCTHCRQLGHRRAFCSPPPHSVPAHRRASKAAWQSPLYLISVRMSWVSKYWLSNSIKEW